MGVIRDAEICAIKNFAHAYSWPQDFARFNCQGPSTFFILYKGLIFAYFLAWLIYSGIWHKDTNKEDFFFIYLTNWNFVLLSISNMLGLLVAVHAHLTSKPRDREMPDQWQPNTPFLYKVHWAIYNMATVAAVIIVVFYWSLLYDPQKDTVDARNLHVHGVNGVYALVDIFLCATPWRLQHFWVPLIYAALYSVFTGVYHAVGGEDEHGNQRIYKVLNYGTSPGKASAYVLILSLIVVPLTHVIFYGFVRLRWLLFESCSGGQDRVAPEANIPMH